MGKVKAIINNLLGKTGRHWDMSDVHNREQTVQDDYNYAVTQRSSQTSKWQTFDNYYNNKHITQLELQKILKEKNIPFTPAVIPDPFIHVESQIIPDIPDFEFNGRDDDMDNRKAKQREYVVRYVLENNKIDNMNSKNERQLNKLGNAFWKVAWNGSKFGPDYMGDIEIGAPDSANIFPDPAAVELDDCEFLIYAYRKHRRAVAREYAKQFKRLDITIDEIGSDGNHSDTEIYQNTERDISDDTLQIVEYWYRQADYGSDTQELILPDPITGKDKVQKINVEWEPGDIACSIQIGGKEVKWIPKYWIKTGRQNKMFPFVKYCKIPVNKSFWDKSEIEPIVDLVDAADRELATAILNDAMNANDIVIMERTSLADGSDFSNVPGAKVIAADGKGATIRRLGGLSQNTGLMNMITFIRSIIQEVVGNFDSAQGKEPIRVTTASGIAQLNERADSRKNIKKADRLSGFERLYELIDWTALEFYDDNRVIYIGAKQEGSESILFRYNSDNMRVLDGMGAEPEYYYPRLDAKVSAGDGLKKSKAFTLQAIQEMVKMQINQTNYKLVQQMVDLMDLPNRKEIKEYLDTLFNQPQQQLPQEGQVEGQAQQQFQQQNQPQDISVEDIISQLSSEELKHLQENPELLDEIIGGMQ